MAEYQTISNTCKNGAVRLYDYCQWNARDHADSICFVKRGSDSVVRTWTWRELHQEVVSVSELMRELQIGPHSLVLNTTANSLEWILLELACSYLNAVHVPIDPRLPTAQLSPIVRDMSLDFALVAHEDDCDLIPNAVPIWTSEKLRGYVDHHAAQAESSAIRNPTIVSPNDVANILFTSGTTSKPKGVMLSHRNLVSNAIAKLDAMPQFANDHRLNLLPFSHAYAKTCELGAWLISASSMEIVSNGHELMLRFPIAKPSLFNGVPILFKRIYGEWQLRGGCRNSLREITGGNIRQFASGGAPILDQLRAAFEQAGLPIYQGYGLTEAGPVVCSNRSGVNHPHKAQCLMGVGPAVQEVDLRIDLDRRLWVRSPGVMLGYWNEPQETKNRILDGWLDTGDVAEFDPSHNVKILGRIDDTIVLENGYKVDPLGVEQLIVQNQRVKDCAVVANDELGFDVVLLCETSVNDNEAQELERELRKLLGTFVHVLPQRVVITLDDWTEENGLRNFKGAKNRVKIKQWVSKHYPIAR